MSLLNVAYKDKLPKPFKPKYIKGELVSEYDKLTHNDLVDKAQSFLKKICYVTCKELKVQNQIESPDVIGFQSYKSIVIECKRSYSDFIQDKRKPFRERPNQGMGDKRYFFALSHTIPVSELPANWGLIEWFPELGKLIITKESGAFQADKVREHMLLITIIRRIGASNLDNKFVFNNEYRYPNGKPFQDDNTLINIGLKDGL